MMCKGPVARGVWRTEVNGEVVSNESGEVGRAKACRPCGPSKVLVILSKAMANQ